MSKWIAVATGGGLSLALAAAALAQSDGLITTAPKKAAEKPAISKEVADLLKPIGGAPIIDLTKDAGKAPATPAPAASEGFRLIVPKSEAAKARQAGPPQPPGPPPTVGQAKPNPLCVVEGVLIACGSTPPAKDGDPGANKQN